MSRRATALHNSPWAGAIYVTGGGSSMLAEILAASGASNTLLDARIPYSEKSLQQLLTYRPKQTCSQTTANNLAMMAYQNARAIETEHTSLFGLSCTASVKTKREKRAIDRFYIAIQTDNLTFSAEMELKENTRAQQELTIKESLWSALAKTLQVDFKFAGERLKNTTEQLFIAPNHWADVFRKNQLAVCQSEHDGKLLFPGSFNPLHRAHQKMLRIAEDLTGLRGAFELSIENVEKPMLNFLDLKARLSQFNCPVWITRLPTFIEKARNFPGTQFIVGIDTITRLVDARYYSTIVDRDNALAELAELDCKFIVFGRTHESSFQTLNDLNLPPVLLRMCTEITKEQFEDPISSSDLREDTVDRAT